MFVVNSRFGSVWRSRSSRESISILAIALLLSSCAGTPGSQAIQDSLKADPSLQTSPQATTSPTPNPTPTSPTPTPTPKPVVPNSGLKAEAVVLPENFPIALPQYPDASLMEVITPDADAPDTLSAIEPTDATDPLSDRLSSETGENSVTPSEIPPETSEIQQDSAADAALYPWQTRWKTSDSIDTVRTFYKRELKRQAWTTQQVMLSQTESSFTVRQANISAVVRIIAGEAGEAGQPTEIVIDYGITTDVDLSPTTNSKPGATPASTANTPANALGTTRFSDLTNLDAIAEPLRSPVAEVVKLGVLTAKQGDRFAPSDPALRRDYVRWLFAAHNRIYADRPSEQLRAITPESSGVIAFQDVPKSDPDFPIIQGLAEAGILPSSLNGNDTTTQFQPDAPLTRETLVMWKVPLDRRRSLPTATIDALQNTWGFQDTEQIAPLALRALLVDFQNGDLSVVRRTFGYTTLFQPKKVVTRAEAAASLWYFGFQGEGRSAKTVLESP